jgi:hypothetical protein
MFGSSIVIVGRTQLVCLSEKIGVFHSLEKQTLQDYILDLYEILHVQGTKRLLEDLDEYQAIQEHKAD